MAVEFKMPEMGENIESADVLNVLVAAGDTIAAEQPVLEIETEKATVEVPSAVAGRVTKVHVAEGDKVKSGQVLLTVEPAGEVEPAAAKEEKTQPPAAKEEKPQRPAAGEKAKAARQQPAPGEGPAPAGAAEQPPPAEPPAGGAPASGGRPVFASPSVRKFAREIGEDVHEVAGSGPGGRISVDDVKEHARGARGEAPAGGGPAAGPGSAPPAPPLPDVSKFGPVEREPMGNVRRTTARHVTRAWASVPHVTVFEKADVTAVEQIRRQYKKTAEQAGGKLTITAILLKVAAAGLKVFPRVNASVDMAAEEVLLKKYYDIGVAVDTERGLVVPVIPRVDQKNIIQLAVELVAAAEKARQGKLTLEEMTGGTFTITNLGSLGTDYFTPIVNWPESAILGVGRARTEPRFADGQFEPRLMLPLSLSFDHRVVDGADGARFLHWVVEALEKPLLLALEG